MLAVLGLESRHFAVAVRQLLGDYAAATWQLPPPRTREFVAPQARDLV